MTVSGVRLCVALTLPLIASCAPQTSARQSRMPAALTIGLGASATTGSEESGLRQITNFLSTDQLVNFARDGRPLPSVAKEWLYSPDGLTLRIRLRESTFHDGTPVTASIVSEILRARLPRLLGPAYEDVHEIRAESERELVFVLKRPSRLVIEALDVPIQKPGVPPIGSGPFQEQERGSATELVANRRYSGGMPGLDRIVLKPYPTVRAAWADLMRGNVDMLYEVGVDALASLEPSTRAKVFSYIRHYQFVVLFNLRRPELQSAALRRGLNDAIDRDRLVADGLGGRGRPSQGPIWPGYWAVASDMPTLGYQPRRLGTPTKPVRLSCLLVDPGHERVAIALQRQLRSSGVQLDLVIQDPDSALRHISAGDFDVALIEVISAPTLLRPYLFWHSKGPYNFGGYASKEVDAALDTIRYAAEDDVHRAGVTAFQRAILNDPPAIFLAWGERARAISTAFDVHVDAGVDPLQTLTQWRPGNAAATAPTGN